MVALVLEVYVDASLGPNLDTVTGVPLPTTHLTIPVVGDAFIGAGKPMRFFLDSHGEGGVVAGQRELLHLPPHFREFLSALALI